MFKLKYTKKAIVSVSHPKKGGSPGYKNFFINAIRLVIKFIQFISTKFWLSALKITKVVAAVSHPFWGDSPAGALLRRVFELVTKIKAAITFLLALIE